ncbi:MAG: dihydropteroate synthase [Nitrospira sp. CR1.3]|nr:dihydropteroate synthase [Nitrospira sp. CR1.3]
MELQARDRLIQWGDCPLIMGIVNVTPDSFFDGGRFTDPEAAMAHAVQLVEEGADLLDIGAESTRPGSFSIDEAEELRRLIPIVAAVAKAVKVPISVDTSKAVVARAAVDTGAVIINDVTALRGDPAMAEVVAESRAGLVLMHMQGAPQTMQEAPHYADVVKDVSSFLAERLQFAMSCGIARRRIILDPGIGFGKLLVNNLDLLAQLHTFGKFDRPVLVGVSRKAFIGTIAGRPVEDRLWGTAAAVALAVEHGAQIVRAHDVRAMRDVAKVASAITRRNLSTLQEQHA